MSNEIKSTRSSGNVFADLELPGADELSIKSELVINLRSLMDLHGLTQTRVAELVDSDQPTISKVLKGHLGLVSTDRLLVWHKRLDQDIQLSITDRFQPGKKRVKNKPNLTTTKPCYT